MHSLIFSSFVSLLLDTHVFWVGLDAATKQIQIVWKHAEKERVSESDTIILM